MTKEKKTETQKKESQESSSYKWIRKGFESQKRENSDWRSKGLKSRKIEDMDGKSGK